MKKNSSMLAAAMATVLLVTGCSIGTASADDQSGAVHPVGHTSHQPAGTPAIDGEPTTASSATGNVVASTRTPEGLLKLLGQRIVSRDVEGIVALHEPEAALVNFDLSVIRGRKQIRTFYVDWFKSNPVLTVTPLQTVVVGGERGSDGKIRNRTASVMGKYSLEQTAPDGTRQSFSGNFCDIVRQQPDGTWMYLNDNPYPPHGG